MGEIADMMLDGTLCEGCGVYIGDGDGFPVRCPDCRIDSDEKWTGLSPAKMNCPECGKRIKKAGLADHIRAKHSE